MTKLGAGLYFSFMVGAGAAFGLAWHASLVGGLLLVFVGLGNATLAGYIWRAEAHS